MDMTDNEILEVLKSRVENHTSENFTNFHKGLDVNKPTYDYIWEKYEHGYLMYSSHSSVFLDPDTGKAHKISEWWKPIYYKKHELLYHLCTTAGNSRVEIPVTCNSIQVRDQYWEHKVVQRPNYELGTEYATMLIRKQIDPTVYFNEYIIETTKILKHLNTVIEELGDGLPEVQMRPTKMLRDSIGYFWIDFKRWVIPQNEYVRKNIDCFTSTLRVWNRNSPDNSVDSDKLLNTAREQWTQIQGY